MFVVKQLKYSLRNSVRLYQPIKGSTTYGLRSFSYVGAKLWNDLSIVIDEDTELSVFKAYVKDLQIDLDVNFQYV